VLWGLCRQKHSARRQCGDNSRGAYRNNEPLVRVGLRVTRITTSQIIASSEVSSFVTLFVELEVWMGYPAGATDMSSLIHDIVFCTIIATVKASQSALRPSSIILITATQPTVPNAPKHPEQSQEAYPSIVRKAVIRSSAISITFAGIENRIRAHPKSLSTPLYIFPGPRNTPCCAKRVKKSCSSSILCTCFASLAKTKMPSVGVTNVTSSCRKTPARRR
jgi:hypothetical protein